jgi:hypothetical protein
MMKMLFASPARMARSLLLGAAVLGTAAIVAPPASAQSCQDLWVERNSYYKEAGYCFSNAGCRYDDERDLPLSRAVRARIAQITRLERRLGCN